MAIQNPTKYVTVRRLNRFRQKFSADESLHPVDVNSLTPSSTFVKNAIIGINGVIYRSKQATSHFPVTLVVSGGAFVVSQTQSGKIAFVVSDQTIHSDWEQWTDAAIEYWVEQLNATKLEMSSTMTYQGQQYTVQQLLEAVASLMQKTIVVKS